jgi:hypothetical protein
MCTMLTFDTVSSFSYLICVCVYLVERCPDPYTYADDANICYSITNTELIQPDAMQACEAQGTHLIRIDNEAKKNVIQDALMSADGKYTAIKVTHHASLQGANAHLNCFQFVQTCSYA